MKQVGHLHDEKVADKARLAASSVSHHRGIKGNPVELPSIYIGDAHNGLLVIFEPVGESLRVAITSHYFWHAPYRVCEC